MVHIMSICLFIYKLKCKDLAAFYVCIQGLYVCIMEVSTCKCSQAIENFVHAKIPVAVLLCLIDFLIVLIASKC